MILERLRLSGSHIETVPRHATHNVYTLAVRNSNNHSLILSTDLKNNTSGNSAYERPTKYSRANTLPHVSVISLHLKETSHQSTVLKCFKMFLLPLHHTLHIKLFLCLRAYLTENTTTLETMATNLTLTHTHTHTHTKGKTHVRYYT